MMAGTGVGGWLTSVLVGGLAAIKAESTGCDQQTWTQIQVPDLPTR